MSEKKVEYIELIYDLIFVYLVGRSNALLHDLSGGFFSAETFLGYTFSTLVILQVWNFSMLFINRYGRGGVADHVGIFINMYLLYYMGSGTNADWTAYYTSYHIAWGLILVNLALQYLRILKRKDGTMPWETLHLRAHMLSLFLQAALVLLTVPLYRAFHVTFVWLPLLAGFLGALVLSRVDRMMPVNFEHLSERVMLYVVFTFGEMIVSVTRYFEGGFSLSGVYFSLGAFLAAAGLFVSYGYLYNHVIDREQITTGHLFLFLHVFLIIALNNITVSLELMPEPEVHAVPKTAFLAGSMLLCYLFLFLIGRHARGGEQPGRGFFLKAAVLSALFAVLTAVFFRNGYLSLAASVLYVFAMFGVIVLRWRPKEKA